MRHIIEWPLKVPKNMNDLMLLESVFDVVELYLWLSYRFSEMFPDADRVRELRQEIDFLIDIGVKHVIQLISLKHIKEMEKVKVSETKSLAPAELSADLNVVAEVEKIPFKDIVKVLKVDRKENVPKMGDENDNEAILNALLDKGVVNKKIIDRIKKELLQSRKSPRNSRK